MKATTRIFGDIDIPDDKLITFPHGIIGFPDLQHFALLHEEGDDANTIQWLQSLDEPRFAIPVLDPLLVYPGYTPEVTEDIMQQLDEPKLEDLLVLVSITVPKNITKMSVNLMGPFLINTANQKAAQVILNNEDYPVKYLIYDILQKNKNQDN